MTLCLNDHIQELDGDALARALACLPPWRRERALAYRHQAGQLQSALAYVELERALALRGSRVTRPRFGWNGHGKPFLPECPGLHFSMSHCRQAVGCLLAEKPCGLDIESIRAPKPTLVRRTMNTEEQERIMGSAAPEVEFTRLWTCKEAVFKLLGTGITGSLPDILTQARERGIRLSMVANPARGYVLTTAVEDG
ncbi:MAG TPA: hypothetical protein DC006_01645 [Prevotellaceae bacterium]|nr:hypothetical protein [Prevotellaceae bacterium]HBE55448.1 hypothetical protein [Prevotellaceae bacterium]